MSLGKLSLAALSAHLVLGNLCMMPMAMAEEMPGMDHGVMSMSHEAGDEEGSHRMPCEGEHCFTHALPTQTSLASHGVLALALPTTPNVIVFSFENEAPVPVSKAPPGQFIHVKTIVMRN